MLTTTSSGSSQQTKPRFQLFTLIQTWFAINPLLTLTGLANIVVLVAALIGIFVDPRIITGVPAWIKPAKFAISITFYNFTLLWIMSFIKGHTRLVGVAAYTIAAALVVEMVIIVGQVIRGTTSHFNVSTPLDSMLWSIMGGFVMLLFVMYLIIAIVVLFQRFPDPTLAWSLRLGVLIALVGMGLGYLMVLPTTLQMTMIHAGVTAKSIGAHTVGLADGGPGIPFLGWSTVAGDLRISHFFGLHALQVLPLVGWLIARFSATWLRTGHRVALILTFGASYLGLVGLLTWQALRAQSIIAPDTLTLQAFAFLLSATALVVIFIVMQARMSIKQA